MNKLKFDFMHKISAKFRLAVPEIIKAKEHTTFTLDFVENKVLQLLRAKLPEAIVYVPSSETSRGSYTKAGKLNYVEASYTVRVAAGRGDYALSTFKNFVINALPRDSSLGIQTSFILNHFIINFFYANFFDEK